jgi:ArsR family transcriptional regulator
MNSTRIFKALADETRLRILCLLLEEELCVGDILDVLQLPQSKVSRHLAYLKSAGLVDDRRCGVWMFYSILDKGTDLQNSILRLLRENSQTFNAAVADRE